MDNMCRICRQTGENSSLQSMMISGLLEIYSFCTNIPITEDNEKCYKICEQCGELLIRFNEFKKLCIESDTFFKQNACIQVKIEFMNEPLQSNIEEDDDFIKDDYSDNDDYPVKEEFDKRDDLVNSENKNNAISNIQCSSKSDISEKQCSSKSRVLTSARHCKFCLKKYIHVKNLKKHYLKCNKTKDNVEIQISKDGIKEEYNFDDTPDKYVCSTCNKEFSKVQPYKCHLRTHTGEKPYECLYCDKKYSDPSSFKSHTQKVHLRTTEHPCHVCAKIFFTTNDLKHHLNSHEKLFECDLCHKKFTKYNLKKHIENHHNKYVNKCRICNEKFENKVDYTNHILIHIKDDPYRCKICESDFIYLTSFKQHVSNEHLGKQYEDCIENPQHLLFHDESSNAAIPSRIRPVKKSKPNPEKKTMCNICGQRFKDVTNLNSHIHIHTGEKPFACDMCDMKFRNRSTLSLHRRRIHEKNPTYSCSYCPYKTYTKNHLTRHITIHFDEKPFVCDVCDASFKMKKSLIVHKRSHTGERPYACTYCDKDFTSLSYLKGHLSVHTGERKFVCKICDKKFSQQTPLNRHMELHKNGNL